MESPFEEIEGWLVEEECVGFDATNCIYREEILVF